jgi:putative DNA primase/helicase
MSPSSAEVTYRPTGAGHRSRTAGVDLSRIPDSEAWLTYRLGPLASFAIRHGDDAAHGTPDAESLDALTNRLTASMQAMLAVRRAAFGALAVRLEAAKPTALWQPDYPEPEEKTEA